MQDELAFPALMEVTPLPECRLHLRYDDGSSGEVSLRVQIERGGVLDQLRDPDVFATVSVGPANQVQWSDEIELCADALYLTLTGRSLEEVVSSRGGVATDA